MTVKTTSKINWVSCPDCGEETIAGSFAHELTCTAKTGTAHTSPIIDGELLGSCDITPEPGEGLEVTYSCYVCGATVKQDASEDISIDSKGNPLCSKTCKAVAAKVDERAEEYSGVPVDAIAEAKRVYIELDREEAVHKAYYAARRDALDRLVGLLGASGHFQDEEGVVYELAPVKGKYVAFIPYEIKRTRRENEPKGTLALDRAEELGYEVARKRKPAKKRTPPALDPKRIDDEIPF